MHGVDARRDEGGDGRQRDTTAGHDLDSAASRGNHARDRRDTITSRNGATGCQDPADVQARGNQFGDGSDGVSACIDRAVHRDRDIRSHPARGACDAGNGFQVQPSVGTQGPR